MASRTTPTPRAIALGAVVAWAAVRALQVGVFGLGSGVDVATYDAYATQWAAGAAPYSTYFPEYPPGAMLLFASPILVGGPYARSFAGQMAIFDVAIVLLLVAWSVRLRPSSRALPTASVATYLATTAILFPVLYARFDLAPAALVLGALYLAYGGSARSVRAGALLLGVAAAIKVWPLSLALTLIGLRMRRDGSRAAMRTTAWIAVGAMLPILPFVRNAGAGVVRFFFYHGQRGIQIESTWATILFLLEDLGISPIEVDARYGALEVQSRLASSFALLSTPLVFLLVLLPQFFAWRGNLGRQGDANGEIGLLSATGALAGFLVAGKVLSPQFLIWILPLVVLAWSTRALGIALALLAAALTTVLYPYAWPSLVDQVEGHRWALGALTLRNAILVALYAACLVRARASSSLSGLPTSEEAP